MSESPLPTRPPHPGENLLREQFAAALAGQSTQMDQLARQLITLELAIPGLYAAVLKLTQGEAATVVVDSWLALTLGCWFLSLSLTLLALIPRRWRVDPTLLKGDPLGQSPALSLEDFFFQSARTKRRLLIPACLALWAGIVCAIFVVL